MDAGAKIKMFKCLNVCIELETKQEAVSTFRYNRRIVDRLGLSNYLKLHFKRELTKELYKTFQSVFHQSFHLTFIYGTQFIFQFLYLRLNSMLFLVD